MLYDTIRVKSATLFATECYRTVITELGRQGILPADLAERLEEAVGFRNALVHEYLTIDKEIVYHSLVDGLADLEGFIDHVYVYLQRNGYVGGQVD